MTFKIPYFEILYALNRNLNHQYKLTYKIEKSKKPVAEYRIDKKLINDTPMAVWNTGQLLIRKLFQSLGGVDIVQEHEPPTIFLDNNILYLKANIAPAKEFVVKTANKA